MYFGFFTHVKTEQNNCILQLIYGIILVHGL